MNRFADSARVHLKFIIGVVIFLCAAALYIRTTAPTLGGAFDSEEFQFAAPSLAIVHSTGYPLYLILGKIFTTFVPIGNIAYRMNLLSALIGAATVVVVYLNALTLTQRQLASIATAALFTTNPAIWRQSGVASVGPLHFLIIALIVYAVLQWLQHTAPLTLISFLIGVGLAHHRTSMWLAIPIGFLILLNDANILRHPRDIAKNLFWLALPLLSYLYMPIFGGASPWYSNTLAGFIQQVSGNDASDFIRYAPSEIVEGFSVVSQYLFDAFGLLGLGLVVLGVVASMRRIMRRAKIDPYIFLGVATLIFYVQGAFYAGEPDRYLALPFLFLIYWFAIGVGTLENIIARSRKAATKQSPTQAEIASQRPLATPAFALGANVIVLQLVLVTVLLLLVVLPFPDHFRIADWSTFDRTYKLWDEVFTLPIPQNATMVGNWGQMNAMRYMQRIEHRRPDLQIVGTLYDPTPQTDATQATLSDGRAIYLAPSVAQPEGDYRYALLGPLLQVYDKPQMQAPATAQNIAINPSLTLADYEVTTALEPYAPTVSIAPNRTARVSLTWRAEDSVQDFLVRLKLFDPDGRLISQKDEAPVRGLYPASQWQRGEYINDVHNFLIPAGSPPGKYQLKLQTLDSATKKSTSDEITIASLDIERVTNLTQDQIFIAHKLNIDPLEDIAILGYGGFEGTHRAGEKITISVLYDVRKNINTDQKLVFTLDDKYDKFKFTWLEVPISFYPTSQWREGELLKAYYDIAIPDYTPPGEITLSIGYVSQMRSIGTTQIVP